MVIDDGLDLEMEMIRTELKYWFRINTYGGFLNVRFS